MTSLWNIYSQGINFNPNRLVVPTKKPHIILDFAEAHGKQHEMQEALFKAYFSEGRDVSSSKVLKELAGKVGLDQDKAIAALSEKKYMRKFEEGIKETKTKGEIVTKTCIQLSEEGIKIV